MMRIISLVITVLISCSNAVFAGAEAAGLDSLAVKASELKASKATGTPVPPAPSAAAKGLEEHTVRVCSYMFASPNGGPGGLGLFAFDVDNSGHVCELPFFQGHPYGPYSCEGGSSASASSGSGETALLFWKRKGGTTLYHQLNVPADFAGLNKFRGKMLISGKPPKDLAEPLKPGAAGVRSISCKTAKVAFPAE